MDSNTGEEDGREHPSRQLSSESIRLSRLFNRWLVVSTILLGIVWVLVVPAFLSMIGIGKGSSPLPSALAAVGSATITLATVIWSSGRFAKVFPVASVLLTVSWRLMGTGGMAAVSAATKWPEHKSFCFWLLGCYFSFFLLESAFSIARIGYLSRR